MKFSRLLTYSRNFLFFPIDRGRISGSKIYAKRRKMTATVHADPAEVINRLSLLGLEEEPLRAAVARGGRAVDVCTANHPKMFPPIAAWAETVCAVREYGAI